MEFQQFLKIILNHKRMIILLCLSAIFHAVLITYILSEKYVATALVLVRPQENITFGAEKKEAFDFPITYNIPFETISQTFTEIIKSRTIAEEVVRKLNIDTWQRKEEENIYYEIWLRLKEELKDFLLNLWIYLKYGRIEEGDSFQKAVAEVQDNISIIPTKDTYLFEIKYKGKHPEAVSLIANTMAEVFVKYSREANRKEAQSTREFFEKQVKENAGELQHARDSLQKFKEQNETISFNEESANRIGLVSDFETSLESTGKQIKGVQAEIEEIREYLADQSEFVQNSETFSKNIIVEKLKNDLAKLEVEHSRLQKVYPAPTNEVQALRNQIERKRAQLNREVEKILSYTASSLNTIQQNLVQNLIFAEAKLQSLQAEKISIMSTIEKYKNELKAFPEKELQLVKLTLNLAVAEDTYKLIKREYERAKIREAKKISEIRVVSPASPPVYPSEPVKIFYAGIAFALALIIGVGFAFFLEYINITIRSMEEAEEIFGVPVLATIPTIKSFSKKSPIINVLYAYLIESEKKL
jgi:uncharacterized protein involved in exopolysaccharide biosynthesis